MPDITISTSPMAASTAGAGFGAQGAADAAAAGPFAALLMQQLSDPALAARLPPGLMLAAAADPAATQINLETLLPQLLGAKAPAGALADSATVDTGAAGQHQATDSDAEETAAAVELLLALPMAAPVALPLPADRPDAGGRALPAAATTATEIAANLAARPETAVPAAAADTGTTEEFAALLGHEQANAGATVATATAPAGIANPAAVAPPPHASQAPAASIPVPVGSRGWDEQVGDRLVWMSSRQESRAELVLTPPQLGRIEVSLTVSGDQTSALFVSNNPAVREALESAMPRLREILADAGITLGQAQVNSEAPGQSAQQRENGDNPRQMRAGGPSGAPGLAGTGHAAGAWASGGRGLVDVFA